jgi:hypothetical protein
VKTPLKRDGLPLARTSIRRSREPHRRGSRRQWSWSSLRRATVMQGHIISCGELGRRNTDRGQYGSRKRQEEERDRHIASDANGVTGAASSNRRTASRTEEDSSTHHDTFGRQVTRMRCCALSKSRPHCARRSELWRKAFQARERVARCFRGPRHHRTCDDCHRLSAGLPMEYTRKFRATRRHGSMRNTPRTYGTIHTRLLSSMTPVAKIPREQLYTSIRT